MSILRAPKRLPLQWFNHVISLISDPKFHFFLTLSALEKYKSRGSHDLYSMMTAVRKNPLGERGSSLRRLTSCLQQRLKGLPRIFPYLDHLISKKEILRWIRWKRVPLNTPPALLRFYNSHNPQHHTEMAATASHGPVMANTSSLKEKPMAVRTANIIAARGVLPLLSLYVFWCRN